MWLSHPLPGSNDLDSADTAVARTGGSDDGASVVAPSITQSEGPIRRTESERKFILDSDDRAESVKPDEVKCRKCQKWIRLAMKSNYALYNWNKHQESCSDAV